VSTTLSCICIKPNCYSESFRNVTSLKEILKAGGQVAIFFCGDLSAALKENDLS